MLDPHEDSGKKRFSIDLLKCFEFLPILSQQLCQLDATREVK